MPWFVRFFYETGLHCRSHNPIKEEKPLLCSEASLRVFNQFSNCRYLENGMVCVSWMRIQFVCFTVGCPRSLQGRQEAFCSGPWEKSTAQSSYCQVYAVQQVLKVAEQNSSCLVGGLWKCMPWVSQCRTLGFFPPFLALVNMASLKTEKNN